MLAFLLGVGVRLYDLTDAPLDFHPTRQLHSALIARGMYYQTLDEAPQWQKDMSYEQWQTEGLIEPQIMERLTAFTCQLMGADNLWACAHMGPSCSGRWAVSSWRCWLTNCLVWPVQSLLLCISCCGPYAVTSSRAFQPESLMVAMIIIGLWAVVRWMKKPTWGRLVTAGILCGLAIYVKSVAVFLYRTAISRSVID